MKIEHTEAYVPVVGDILFSPYTSNKHKLLEQVDVSEFKCSCGNTFIYAYRDYHAWTIERETKPIYIKLGK